MLGRRLTLAMLALAVAAPSARAEPVFERYKVPTVGGAEINVEVRRPDGGERVPVILTYSPYNTLGEYTTPNLANDELGETFLTGPLPDVSKTGSRLRLPLVSR